MSSVQRKRRDFLFYYSSVENHKGPILWLSTKPTEHTKGRGELLSTTSSYSLFCYRTNAIHYFSHPGRELESWLISRSKARGKICLLGPKCRNKERGSRETAAIKSICVVIRGIPVIPVTSFNPADLLMLGHERVKRNHSRPSPSALPYSSSFFAPR